MKTISETILKHAHTGLSSRVLKAVLVISGSLLLIAASKIAIPVPFSPVPVTGQTFAVLLLGGLLGPGAGVAAVGLYLLQGLAGLPVFAGPGAGPLYFFGPTGGYLIGFLPAAFIAGTGMQRRWCKSLFSCIGLLSIASCVIFAFGLLWLSAFIGFEKACITGVLPFLPGAALKIALASAILHGLSR